MIRGMKWVIRLLFWTYFIYIYLTVVDKDSFYSFLLLNTFLAYLPIEISFHINEKQPLIIFLVLFIVWIVFYPNVPYILTDLFHLSRMNPYDVNTGLMSFNLHMWLNYTNLVISAIFCAVLGTWNVQYISDVLMARLKLKGIVIQTIIFAILTFIASVGVYIGRFLRLHTAYLFLNPQWTTSQIALMWNKRMLVFVAFMMLIQMAIWLGWACAYYSLSKFERENNLLKVGKGNK